MFYRLEKKTGANMRREISLRPSQVLCCICLQQKFVKFFLQLWRYRCVAVTWLPWATAMWLSNGAKNVCLKGIGISPVMAGGAFPRLLVPQLILTEDQSILLDLVTPSRNIVLSSPRCVLETMTIWFLCQLSFTIDSVKMFKNLRGTVIF